MDTAQVDDQVTLECVQQQFSDWRASRSSKREHIPDRLWQVAVHLCGDHSINQVSRSLRLSYTELKRRVLGATFGGEKSVQFMRLEVGSPYTSQWQMECIRANGSRLRLSGTGVLPPLGEVLRGFWS